MKYSLQSLMHYETKLQHRIALTASVTTVIVLLCVAALFVLRAYAADHSYRITLKPSHFDGRLRVEQIETNQGWQTIAMLTCSDKYLATRYASSRNVNVFALIVMRQNSGWVGNTPIEEEVNAAR